MLGKFKSVWENLQYKKALIEWMLRVCFAPRCSSSWRRGPSEGPQTYRASPAFQVRRPSKRFSLFDPVCLLLIRYVFKQLTGMCGKCIHVQRMREVVRWKFTMVHLERLRLDNTDNWHRLLWGKKDKQCGRLSICLLVWKWIQQVCRSEVQESF